LLNNPVTEPDRVVSASTADKLQASLDRLAALAEADR
jgi:hypothetical protein